MISCAGGGIQNGPEVLISLHFRFLKVRFFCLSY